ncbi:MAG: TonB-dependent receptor [Bergeyella zoohelcum]|nr:TonB-dependent receptor [Bergeyella zoohelcum]
MIRTEIIQKITTKTIGLAMLSVAAFVFAQEKKSITGKITDKQNNPVPYASVSFNSKENKLYSDATLTDEQGNYSLQLVNGDYEIIVEAIDFKKYSTSKEILGGEQATISIEREQTTTHQPTKSIEGVTITAATTKAYKVELDKKVYDPSTDLISKGGNLQDVLTNVPSVEVDTDGTVSLRGSSNVRFLINGKPSSLLGIDDSASALQSIPADQIERIEVITNPSSKYEASGTAGILNIILKKTKSRGFNGSVAGTLGYLPLTRLNTNLNWKQGSWIWYLNGGGGYNERKNTRRNNTRYFSPSGATQSYLDQDSDNENQGKYYNANAGFAVDITEKMAFNLSGMVRYNENESKDLVTYNNYDANRVLDYISNRLSLGSGDGIAMQGDIGLDYKFNTKGHNLSTSFSIQRNKNYGYSNILETEDSDFVSRNIVDQVTINKTMIGKIDYELPLGENSRLEAGYRFDRNENDYDYGVKQSTDDVNFTQRLNFTSNTIYTEMFNAFYVQFRSKVNRLGYQLGLRSELSDIKVDFYNEAGTNSNINKNYNGFFPSVFLSYDLGEGTDNQLFLNYSRRIDRPRSWSLVPFNSFNLNDDRNQFLGNPDLNPEYENAIELGYAIQKKKFTINPTLYYKHHEDETEMVVVQESPTSNILVTRPYNLGSETKIGLDINATADIFSWWKIIASANIFRYNRTGEFFDETIMTTPYSFAGKGFSSRFRLSNTFKIDKTMSIQLQGFYRGAEKTDSNNRKSSYAVNFGANKTIWNGSGTIAFNIQDIFNTKAMRSTSYGTTFEREQYMQFEPRQFSLSLTYRFKQGEKVETKKLKRNNTSNDFGNDDEMPMQ